MIEVGVLNYVMMSFVDLLEKSGQDICVIDFFNDFSSENQLVSNILSKEIEKKGILFNLKFKRKFFFEEEVNGVEKS